MPIKIDIISGFLGAGKTTLIQKLIRESFSDQKIVLIENEFGEIGIDGSILKQTGMQVQEINSGCICCSLAGSFDGALKDVIHRYHPERVIIEPSGVGKLSDIIQICHSVEDSAEINSLITVVDAVKYRLFNKDFGEFYNNQIQYAQIIVLSRTQKLSNTELTEIAEMLRNQNPDAAIVTTPWDDLDGSVILQAVENQKPISSAPSTEQESHCCEHHHGGCSHAHTADEEFEVWNLQTPKQFEIEQLESILNQLSQYGTVLRSKGIVALADGTWLQFDYVPDEITHREIAADYTGKICVIGKNLQKTELQKLFGR